MNKKPSIKNRTLAGLLSMVMAASLLATVIVLAEDSEPTVHIEGLELRMVAEYETDEYGQYLLDENERPIPVVDKEGNQVQSVQALVSISITNAGLNTGVFIPLHYNEDYLIPSDWKTNGAISTMKSGSDAADELHHSYFRVDEQLYEGKDPFEWRANVSYGSILSINDNTDILGIHLYIKNDLPVSADDTAGKIVRLSWKGRPAGEDRYIKSGDEKTFLGTVSFRINETYLEEGSGSKEENLQANLKKLVDKFNGSQTGGPVDPGDTSGPLLATYKEGDEHLEMLNLKNKNHTEEINSTTLKSPWKREDINRKIEYKIDVNAEDVITKVEPVKKEVVINAYEAFTDGAVSDLALAMQKYAESVRVTYVSEKQEDRSIYWGDPAAPDSMPADGPGMFIQKKGDDKVYRFTWDPVDKTKYTFEEKQSDGTFVDVPLNTISNIYDPRGGDYIISQYYTYMEVGGVPSAGEGNGEIVHKTYPTPVEVHLIVTPVKAVDAVVDEDSLTYLNNIDVVPRIHSNLDLAEEAKLVLDTTLDGVFPTVPLTWTPGVLDSTVTGTPGTGNPASVAVWPFTADEFAAKTGIGDYTFNTYVEETNPTTQTGVRDRYPWLTTGPWLNDSNGYRLELESVRHIVDESYEELSSRYVAWAEPFEENLGDEIGRLRVTIAKRNEDDTGFEDMNAGYKFKLFMPNGQEIMVDPNGWFGAKTGTSDVWSDSTTNAYYGVTGPVGQGKAEGKRAYTIVISPGDLPTVGNSADERELLRRNINLGGWYGVRVCAPSANGVWTDTIPAFSEPRVNIYTKNYIENPTVSVIPTDRNQHLFDYTGNRLGLMPFYINSDLPTFVTLPADDFIETRYDAFTGAQPGTLRQFQIEPSPTTGRWPSIIGSKTGAVSAGGTVVAPAGKGPVWDWKDDTTAPKVGEVVTYGADLFARSHEYGDYGTVINPDTADGYSIAIANSKAMIKVQLQDKEEPTPEKDMLLLTYEQTGDNITPIHNDVANVDEVKRVTFNSKQVGYTYQQIVTLTLTNAGDQEIKGLYIDVPTLTGANGPYFTIISAPAANLPVGAKTTFQISYVQNLPVGDYENTDKTLPVEIHHNRGEKTFEAVLQVTESKPNRVTIVVHPDTPTEGRVMGDANLVVGVDVTDDVDSYDGSAATNWYEKDDIFWVLTEPEDEYALLTLKENDIPRVQVYYMEDYIDDDNNPAQRKVYLNEYLPSGPNPDFGGTATDDFLTAGKENERLFWCKMPEQAVTVHVHYYEPQLSKLRLSDLHAYAWDEKSEAVWNDTLDPPQWEDEKIQATGEWKYEKQLHENQAGNYAVTLFDPQKDEYIVILDDEATGGDNWCGVSVRLRNLKTHINGVEPDRDNQDIYPNVVMNLDDGPSTPVGAIPVTGSTVGPTTHRSIEFEAPTVGAAQNSVAQKTVIITISYDGTDLVPPEGEESRVYKVRFVRKRTGEALKDLAAGNSPYGMIENDSTILDKAVAKAIFDQNNRFAEGCMPHQAGQLNNIYWPEAWGDGENYDKDETALFVYLGQEFYDPGATNIYNNAGDQIDGVIVKRTLTDYYQMASQTAAIDRFSQGSIGTTAIDLGEVLATKGAIPGESMTATIEGEEKTYSGMVEQFKDVTDIRPGVYKLTYTFVDYDGTTTLYFTRPLIVLSPNGDVNADLSLTTNIKDAEAIRRRFRTPLPLELENTVYSDSDKLVYQYRIVDANNDRNINDVDANLIRKVTALLFPAEPLTEFYRPTEYTYPVKP